MAGAAVVVIDVQRAFFFGLDAAYRGDEVVAGINRLTGAARAVGAPVFFVQMFPGLVDLVFGDARIQDRLNRDAREARAAENRT